MYKDESHSSAILLRSEVFMHIYFSPLNFVVLIERLYFDFSKL